MDAFDAVSRRFCFLDCRFRRIARVPETWELSPCPKSLVTLHSVAKDPEDVVLESYSGVVICLNGVSDGVPACFLRRAMGTL